MGQLPPNDDFLVNFAIPAFLTYATCLDTQEGIGLITYSRIVLDSSHILSHLIFLKAL